MKIMTTQALEHWRENGVDFALVDVLSHESFVDKHIPGSVSAPLVDGDFVDRVTRAVGGDLDKRVVVYCASTTCDASPRAARRLELAGFANVYDYESGLQGWESTGHEVEAGRNGS